MSDEHLPLSKRKCLAICGAKGAGKDTLARFVEQANTNGEWGWKAFNHIKFSTVLKDIACLAFGWDRERMDDLDYKEEVLKRPLNPIFTHLVQSDLKTRREVLQQLGTDVFRQMDPDIWVKATLRNAIKELESFDPDRSFDFIATDCRFENEAEALKWEFEEVVFVKVIKGGEGYNPDMHSSESWDGGEEPGSMTFNFKAGDTESMQRIGRLLRETAFDRPMR